uniref:Uncharacterized protein n=1 Tax=Poecilia latipinna TaxID=48699 RepID=A0A3B3THT6_9TELE
MVPFTIIDFFIDCFGLRGSRAHIQQQVQMAVQHLNGKEVHFKSLGCLGKAVGFGGAEVKGDGPRLFGVPLVENNIRLGCLKSDGVQSGYILTLKGHSAMDFHLGVTLLSQPRQLEPHIVVFINNLKRRRRE